MSEKNWSGNVTFQSRAIHRPATRAALQEIVAQSKRIKALGTRHSFNELADTSADHVSTENLKQVLQLDRDARTVTVEGGMRYGELGEFLHGEGFGLHNLASLPHISVAGACATATHGSGARCGNLATAVTAIELILADGSAIQVSKRDDPELFAGVVVGLGALGVVSTVTLDIEPSYQVRQDVYENLPLSQLQDSFDEILSSAYSVSLFTDWRGESFHQLWQKRRVAEQPDFVPPPVFHGGTLAKEDKHPIPEEPPESCTPQLGRPGPWHQRLQHFRLEYTPSSGEELQSEYLFPRERAFEALRAVFDLREKLAPYTMASEVRAIARDELWLSPCYQEDCAALHFTWKPKLKEVVQLLPEIESALAPFSAVPHWGKLSTVSPKEMRSMYSRFKDFAELAARLDPHKKFRNAFLDSLLEPDR